ncbi:MAG: imidazole glycerol phosphate synthase subunit HisH [Acidobacteria bacterium]|nr:MAG: imidazole glycerol phosphate synthase subunit HisH [Acidobacteriota bacterium]
MNGPDVVVLDYGMGNLHSVSKALERAGAQVRLATSPNEVGRAAAMVLPGVGNFGRCAENLRAAELDRAVLSWIEADRPFFGICVGMQLLFEGSDESELPGLGVLEGRVVRIPSDVRVPHMGWNTVDGSGPIFEGLEDSWFYFVHSFAADAEGVGMCEYGMRFAAAVERGQMWATQFHPEKSAAAGLKVLGNFVGRL